PRVSIEFTATAHGLKSGAVQVAVTPRDATLELAANAEGQDLERAKDGTLRGRVSKATEAKTIKLAVGAPGALGEPVDLEVLAATLAGVTRIQDGKATVSLDLALDPPRSEPATPTVVFAHGTARLEGSLKDKGRFEVALEGVEPGSHELELSVPLARGAEARARVAFGLEPAPSWKKHVAVACIAAGLLWVFVVAVRK